MDNPLLVLLLVGGLFVLYEWETVAGTQQPQVWSEKPISSTSSAPIMISNGLPSSQQ